MEQSFGIFLKMAMHALVEKQRDFVVVLQSQLAPHAAATGRGLGGLPGKVSGQSWCRRSQDHTVAAD